MKIILGFLTSLEIGGMQAMVTPNTDKNIHGR
jgi:hypothetical protein